MLYKQIAYSNMKLKYENYNIISSGISALERSQRKEKNILATEVNFTRWLFEVGFQGFD